MDTSIVTVAADHILLRVKVIPAASRTQLAGIKEGRLRIHIAAAPEDGKANLELKKSLAKLTGCSKSEVVLVSGEKSRVKTLSFPPHCEAAIRRLIEDQKKGPN